MKTATDSDSWRQKYFDSLGRLEAEQARFGAIEASLKRLAARLCTASLGQSVQLDAQLRKLQSTIRREIASDELDRITAALTDAIQALDSPAGASPAAAPAQVVPLPGAAAAPVQHGAAPAIAIALDDEPVRAVLATLLLELRGDPELGRQIDALDAALGAPLAPDELPQLLNSFAELVGKRIRRIEGARQEIEALLGHMVQKLDEVGQFVADQNRSQSESQASSETLNLQLADEMKAMGESVEAARDVQQIRLQVRSRLDSIDRHLQEFRDREATLLAATRTRNEQMRSRIAELEAEANHLHSQLQNEQRLSTIDVLTGVPNRLAYEKRMDEELKRWQRFRQPTCIAVWDVDHFKRINDTYGHRAGDRVLRTVAECLAQRIRGTDFLARYGGEEFVMILPGTGIDDAARVVDEMRISVTKIGFHFRGTPVSITISSGVTALLPEDSAGTAFDRADKALYQAKANGRNRCICA